MELPVNTFKRALAAGKPQIGLWSTLTSSYAIEAIAGVIFTGSTGVARTIQRQLAGRLKDGRPIPLIAETGGLNAMVVDSTALPEQVIDAVVQAESRLSP